jgi:rhodanese-related sulfurtransferase
MILYCALGMRSALAVKSLVEMGFENVAHVNGGFDSLKQSGLEVVSKDKK